MNIINQNSTRSLLRFSLIPLLAVFALAAQAQQRTGERPFPPQYPSETVRPAQTDASFIKHAVLDNQQEIQLGQLGTQKAQNPQLQNFSQRLVQEHQNANASLQSLAQSYNVQTSQPLPSQWQSEINRLQGLSGPQFDKEFTTYVLRDHAQDVNYYQREATLTQNAELRSYAQNTSHAMQSHLHALAAIAPTVGVDQNTVASIMNSTQGYMGAPATPTGREEGRATTRSPSGRTGARDQTDPYSY